MIIGISGKIGSGKDLTGRIIQYLTSESFNIMTFEEYESSESKFRFDPTWQIKKFADKLKEICSILTGIPKADFEKQEVKDSLLGEEWGFMYDKLDIHTTYKNLGGYGVFIGNEPQIIRDRETRVLKRLREIIKTAGNRKTVRWLLQTVGTEAMRDKIHQDVWVNALFADYKYDEWTSRGDQSEPIFPNWIITDVRFPNELKAIKDRKGITIRISRIQYLTEENLKKHEHPSETAIDNATFDYTIDNNGTIEELVKKVKEILIKEKII